MCDPVTLTAVGIGAAGAASGAMQASAAKKGAKAQAKQANLAIAEQRRQFDTMLSYLDPVYTDARLANSYYMTALGLYPDTNYRPESAMPSTAATTTQGATPAKPVAPWAKGGALSNAAGEAMGDQQTGTVTNPDGSTAQAPYTPGKTQADIVSMVQDSPGYQTQLQTGIEAIDRAAVSGQGLTSGRRLMALNDYGQQTFGSFYDSWLSKVGGIAGQAAPTAGAIGQGAQNMANSLTGIMTRKGDAQATGYANAASAWSDAFGDIAGAAGWRYGAMTGGTKKAYGY